jgi:hypothetical protein
MCSKYLFSTLVFLTRLAPFSQDFNGVLGTFIEEGEDEDDEVMHLLKTDIP